MRHWMLLIGWAGLAAATVPIWPRPRDIVSGNGTARLAGSFSVSLDGCDTLEAPHDLLDAVADLERRIRGDRLAPLEPGRGERRRAAIVTSPVIDRLTLRIEGGGCADTSIAAEAVTPVEKRRALERYVLDVTKGGEASITATGALGLLRGMQSFAQLVFTLPSHHPSPHPQQTIDAYDAIRFIDHVPLHVVDEPAFGWRAFLLDTSRNRYDVVSILRLLDTMSMVKFSVFHWHVTDSHSWPLEVPAAPELASAGAYDASAIYTVADVAEITSFANARGIDVVLEIDKPGHTTSVAESHPELIACREAEPWTMYANEPPAGQLRIGSNATRDFVKTVLDDYLPRLTSSYFATGGDEINGRCYLDDRPTRELMAERGVNVSTLLQEFVAQSHDTVRRHRLTPVVWEELLSIDLASDAIVLPWRSNKTVRAALNRGLRIVHAQASHFYLDWCVCGRNSPDERSGQGGWLGGAQSSDSWCGAHKSWHHMLAFDPLANVSAANAHLVLGAQTSLWSEQTDGGTLDSVAWPRAAALTELTWHGYGSDLGDALTRLHALRYRMVARGVRAAPLQPEWCALRPGQCDLPSS